MALNKQDLIKLSKIAASADSNAPVAYSFGEEQYSFAEVNELLRKELNELTSTYALWRENKNTVFSIIEETFDDILPKKVEQQYGLFAEIKTIPQGDKAVFTQRITEASRRRAKQFITRVGLAGKYEVFKLDGAEYEIKTGAIGGAAQLGLEEFLDSRRDMADLMSVLLEGLDELIYREIANALIGTIKDIQPANKFIHTSFSETDMDKLLQIADSYGQSTIYCTFEFAATMLPAQNWISEDMKNQRWQNGYLGNYKGHNVIVLEQSFVDETNTTKVMDPSYAFIIPTGAEKPVKVVFEGQTITREVEREDWSREIQTYKKVGVGAIVRNNICVYQNTSLAM